MEPYTSQPEEQTIFDDLQYHLVQASTGKRFANYFIDLLTFYVFIFFLGMFLAVASPSFLNSANDSRSGFGFVERLVVLVLYGFFMFLIEVIFKGKSLGKLITGTRAVKEDGTLLTAKDALLRGLSRMVPFEAFSALGSPSYPWHDKWSKTFVIDEKQSQFPIQ
ncbi:MAG TPA: RDD family protein [Puia sp.]|jgi:uncharacterized RDD family membrane protein YckC|nr:RDD family protein [Puia sp.]